MHDYDSEFVWDYEISCHDYIEESTTYESMYDSYEDYTRNDSTDYQALAYMHFAWYNSVIH